MKPVVQHPGWTALRVALVCALVLLGCKPQSRPETLVLAEAGQAAFGLMYIAAREGYFQEEGLEVRFQRYTSGRDALAAVLAGEADVGTPFDTPVVIAIERGEPIRVLSTLAVGYGNNAVIARRDRGIEQAADLRGRRIATIPDTSADYLLSLILASAGIEPEAVERRLATPLEAAEALIRGEVDAAVLWAPHSLRAEQALGAEAVSILTSPVYLEAVTLCTTEQRLKTREEALRRLLRALVRAEDLSLNEPERALSQVVAALDEQSEADVRAAWSKLRHQVRLDNLLLVSLEGELAWYGARTGGQPSAESRSVDIKPYLAPELLSGIRPQNVTLRSLPGPSAR